MADFYARKRCRNEEKVRIDITRFGPIDKFSCDMDKDLIVIYGNNNIGKSYSMQVIYLLLKACFGNGSVLHYYKKFLPMERGFKEKDLRKIQDFIVSEKASMDISGMVVQCVYEILGEMLLPDFISSCQNTFGNFEKVLEKEPVITIKHLQYCFDINLEKEKIAGSIEMKPILLRKIEAGQCSLEDCGEHIEVGVISDEELPEKILSKHISEIVSACILSIRSCYENVYFLPASRSGIYSGMSAFGSIVAELSRKRAYFNQKIDIPGISEPIADYFISLSKIDSNSKRNSDNYGIEVEEIEEKILKGEVIFHKNKNALMYQPRNMGVSFSMTEVSSMVSEISPVVAFLKYVVSGKKDRKSILFIEEPEAHLHPDNQIALIEIFSKLVCKNVKLVMSTHSNYVFNKLNNLLLAKKLDCGVYQPIILEEKENGSVSKFLLVDELGAEDENFIDASERLYFERNELIQQRNMEEEME